MIALESSSDRSVNNGAICGVVIWIIKNEKKPMSASVTAAIAAIRAAPSDFTKLKKPCTGFLPTAWAQRPAHHPARFAQFMVSVRLTQEKLHFCVVAIHDAAVSIAARRKRKRRRNRPAWRATL